MDESLPQPSDPETCKRIRIFFIGCPTLDTAAASHLLLSQNAAQTAIQFEIYHYWIFGHITSGKERPRENNRFLARPGKKLYQVACDRMKWFDRRERTRFDFKQAPAFGSEIDRNQWFEICEDALGKYDEWFSTIGRPYDVEPCPTIVITEAALSGGYLSQTRNGIGLISTAHWKTFFKPVSALDYLLFSVQRLAVRLAYTNEIGSHYPTRGCLWDFHPHQPDARISILLGHLCSTCEAKIKAASSQKIFDEISTLLQNKWLGDKNIQFTPAAILAHIHKYDLSRSTGLNANFFTRAWEAISAETGKIITEGLKWAFVLIITLGLAAYFPEALNKIRSQLTGKLESAESKQTNASDKPRDQNRDTALNTPPSATVIRNEADRSKSLPAGTVGTNPELSGPTPHSAKAVDAARPKVDPTPPPQSESANRPL